MFNKPSEMLRAIRYRKFAVRPQRLENLHAGPYHLQEMNEKNVQRGQTSISSATDDWKKRNENSIRFGMKIGTDSKKGENPN